VILNTARGQAWSVRCSGLIEDACLYATNQRERFDELTAVPSVSMINPNRAAPFNRGRVRMYISTGAERDDPRLHEPELCDEPQIQC
jgi:hypothetical protein